MKQSTVPNELLPSQLQQRSDELDEREALVVEREVTLDSLKKDIKLAAHQLKVLNSSITSREALLVDHQKQIEELDSYYTKQLKVLQDKVASGESSVEKVQGKVRVIKLELQSIQDSIVQRTAYQRQQEQTIATQAESGNDRLLGLQYEVLEATRALKDSKSSIRLIIENKQLLEADIVQARADFQPEIDKHKLSLKNIDNQIVDATDDLEAIFTKKDDLTKQINKIITRQKVVNQEIETKLTILDSKEREIMAKREALRAESEELEEKRHHFTRDSLYDGI